MGLFSRNKRQEQPPRSKSPPPRPAPVTLYEPVTTAPQPRTQAFHPPSGLSVSSPQPDPSSPQFQQQLFHQTYQFLNQGQHPQQQQQALVQQGSGLEGAIPLSASGPYAQPPQYAAAATGLQAVQAPYGVQHRDADIAAATTGAGVSAAASVATPGNGGGLSSTELLRQAVRAAAREGRPLKLDFIGQMQPVMANNQYGISMPHQHPYGPAPYGPNPYGPLQGYGGMPVAPPEGWQPGTGKDPYESIRIPALPDMRGMPADLQDFRDQCATGVRQAVAMITAMEHQLWWERSRRQQAEEDCKVLLAAVHLERGAGEKLLSAEERRRAEAAEAAAKLTLAADELPQASEAATTIQKYVRGHLARKEFESHLRDILRGLDPSLDPAALPAVAQSHISHVNTTGAPRRVGLRTILGEAGGIPSSGPRAAEQVDEATAYYRRQVDRIGQRLASHKDAGQPHPGDTSGDPLLRDVKELLSGSYPASSAQVIAALVRRCRELQAALLEAVGELQEAQLSIQGLKDANAKVSELSGVRADLEASRQESLRLAATVAKLRTALGLHAAGFSSGGGSAAARENPYVAAWYRKAYADREWQRVPPGGPGGVALMDAPDTAVETWDDLRASVPEPVIVPRVVVPGTHYRDSLGLKQDMIKTASLGPPDPLYTMPVPDNSGFVYARDTPLMPMQTTAPLIRESMPPDIPLGPPHRLRSPHPSSPGGFGTPPGGIRDAYHGNLGSGGSHQPSPSFSSRLQQAPAGPAAAAYPQQQGVVGGSGVGTFRYNQDTPVVPVYSVLPLIREDEFIRRSTSPQRDALLPPSTPPLQQLPLQQQPPQQPHVWIPAGVVNPASDVSTPLLLPRQPSNTVTTNMPYIRDRVQAPPPPPLPPMHSQVPPEVVAGAAVASLTAHPQPAMG